MRNLTELWRANSPWSPFFDFTSEEETRNTMMGFNPPCEVDEQDDHFFISVDLPGISKDEVKVEVVDDRLVISGERKSDKKNARATERYYGRFERAFTLPTNVESEKIEARFENGVLELAIPKAERAKPRTVQIQSGKKANDRLVS
jgi:HSP20 family protein